MRPPLFKHRCLISGWNVCRTKQTTHIIKYHFLVFCLHIPIGIRLTKMPVSAQYSPSRPSIRETIAARRAELRNTPKSQRTGDLQTYGSPAGKRAGTPRGFVHLDGSGADLLEDKTVEGQLKKAAKSGKLR